MTIIEFLEARIAEDEIAAYDIMGEREGDRMLAECAAKRAIIGWWTNGVIGHVEIDGELTNPLLPLAAIYADHEDYQQEWAK